MRMFALLRRSPGNHSVMAAGARSRRGAQGRDRFTIRSPASTSNIGHSQPLRSLKRHKCRAPETSLRLRWTITSAGVFLLAAGVSRAWTADAVRVEGTSGKPIAISISGFSGEVDHALRFDLFVAGFTNEGPDSAQYVLSGSNNGTVQGR